MKKFQLRDYQADDLKRINKEIKAGHKRVIYSLMTAGGKTVVLHEQVSRWLRKGMRGCVLVHTRALLKQTCDVFSDLTHGIIAGGITPDTDKKLQICMVQSLARRGGKSFDFIVVDECHHATASTWAKILADSPDAIILGVTATPFRNDNRGLGQAGFTTIVEGPEVSWLTEQGYLSPVEYYAPTDVDMTGVKKVGGDYEKKESGRRANKRTITGSAVEHYKRHAMGQRALAFCVDIKHVMAVTKQFKKAGLNATFIHGKMSNEEREDILAQFAASKDMILVSCELIGEGLDVPAVACIILLRPTASLVRHIQQVGRGLRVIAGKKHVVVLDHVGNIRLGHPHVPRPVDLDGVQPKAKSLDENSPKSYLRTCPKCKRVETADVLVCSTCGHKFKAVVRGKITGRDGELRRIDGLVDKKIKAYPCSAGNGYVKYAARINGYDFNICADKKMAFDIADKLSAIDGVFSLGKDAVAVEIRRLRMETSENFLPVKPVYRKAKHSDGIGYVVSIGAVNYALGNNKENAIRCRNWLTDWYVRNSFEWPKDLESRARLVVASRAHSDPMFLKMRLDSGRYYRAYINGTDMRFGSEKYVANKALSICVDFFIKNNYEWPPKPEIPALVKKALEHAKSTVE